MGGSGGGFFGGSRPEKLAKDVRQEKERIRDQAYETEVAEMLNQLLVKFNDRDVDSINTHLDEIRMALDRDIDGTVDLQFGGSVDKHTYVDGLSDIDCLVQLNKSELESMSPQEVKSYLASRLKERFPNTDIREGTLAVTVSFGDAEIQLLPAIKHKSGYQIPDSTGSQWSYIKPQEFTSKLTKVNRESQSKLVPTIKLAKSIISTLPKSRQLTGYHVEAIAADIFGLYNGPKTTKAMLTHFFNEAPKRILSPVKDTTGQSTYVDDYLGSSTSLARRMAADTIGRIGRRMKNADGAGLSAQWEDILGD